MSYMSILQQSLNYRVLNTKVISNNIANVSTPNYKQQEVDVAGFNKTMKELTLKTNSANQITNNGGNGNLKTTVINDPNASAKENGNSVNLNQQLVNMIKNQDGYQFTVSALDNQFNLQKLSME